MTALVLSGILFAIAGALFLFGWLLEKVLHWLHDRGYRFGGLLHESDDPFRLR